MNTAYFDCFSGISGNMVIGALIDAGYPAEALREELGKLNLEDTFELVIKRVTKLDIGATYFNVTLPETSETGQGHDHEHSHDEHMVGHRGLSEILTLIGTSSLDDAVKATASRIFTRLGYAEAKIHGCSPDEVHFHEVGAIDAIIDIVGTAAGLAYFGVTRVLASALHVGNGMVRCAHGIMPIPAPATSELLRGIPFYSGTVSGELVTPTGAAIISTLAESVGPMPPFLTDRIAYGAGTWDLSIPNVLRLYLGELVQTGPGSGESATVIETNIDDMNPEFYSHVTDLLFAAGAVDVFLNPVGMKRNRPGVVVTVISTLEDSTPLVDILFRETSSIGVRTHKVDRFTLDREIHSVTTEAGAVKVKVSSRNGRIMTVAPEFEDCRLCAVASGIPVREVYRQAQTEAHRRIPPGGAFR
jgi:pyridinium-3,5-bisthiocarboxylic acid mononucleotide nickel chelatase